MYSKLPKGIPAATRASSPTPATTSHPGLILDLPVVGWSMATSLTMAQARRRV